MSWAAESPVPYDSCVATVQAPIDLDLRAEVRSWLAANIDRTLPRKEWLARVIDGGWAVPTWPPEWWGRGLSSDDRSLIDAEFAAADASGSGQDRWNLWANTVVAYGTDALKGQVVRRLLTDDLAMCLLYSEPGAGSDLAGLATRAERDGDEWVINGQKVWTSGGRQAEYAFLLARTNSDVSKHQGISFFFFPMRQPGVEVRPLRQATGDARFNEVFLTDARVPHANMLGGPGEGWKVLQTALAYERIVMGIAERGPARAKQKSAAERDPTDEASAPEPDLVLVELARQRGRANDPLIRQHLARIHALRSVNTWNNGRAAAAMANGTSSPLASLGKLAMSQILHYSASVEAEILGAEAMVPGPSYPRAADNTYALLNAFFTSIGGGTDQIQRNIIAERILGLPKEPEVDKGVPFREVKRAITGSPGA